MDMTQFVEQPPSIRLGSGISNGASLAFLGPEDVLADPRLLEEWESMQGLGNRLNSVLASPSWFFHRWRTTKAPEIRLAVLRDDHGDVVGVCPIDFWNYDLRICLGKRLITQTTMKAAVIMGGEPLLPPDPQLFRLLIEGIFRELAWSDCILMGSLPVDGTTWKLIESRALKPKAASMLVEGGGARPWRFIEFGESLEQYLQDKSPGSRHKLRNLTNRLRKHSEGKLEFQRIDSVDQIDSFCCEATEVRLNCWQARNLGVGVEKSSINELSLRDLAEAKLLRAYMLKSGPTPLAYFVGYQRAGVYYAEEMAYDERYSTHSPGRVLMYLMLEDMFCHDKPNLLNHGTGDNLHKQRFCNRVSSDFGVIFFRRTPKNVARVLTCRLFESSRRIAKRLLKRKPTGQVPVEGS